ncbi:MAG TPA: hypothetical protein VMW54_13465 [Terriglobia bacterium]|nr:hypothetical protein [Terriglobia bacterium]
MSHTIQYLGSQLQQWQALYVVSIMVALLSTFSILVFTFHIKREPFAKWSNYIYVIASVLAVLSTIVIISKTRSLDAAKDRQTSLQISDANKKIATINSSAQIARTEAEDAKRSQEKLKLENLKLELKLRGIQHSYVSLSSEFSASSQKINRLEQEGKLRRISAPQQTKIIALLRAFSGQKVVVRLYAQGYEAQAFANEVVSTLAKAGLKPELATVLGAFGEGFGVVVHDRKSVPPLAIAIIKAFRSAAVPIGGEIVPQEANPGTFFIAIGSKPHVPN